MRRGVLRGDMALDTSVLVEVALATSTGRELTEQILSENVRPYVTVLNLAELLYVLCRLLGMGEAEERVKLIVDSNYFEIIGSDDLWRYVADCKCRFAVSLADCHTLALARKYGIPALFYRLESEFKPITAELRAWVGSEVFFIREE